MRAPGMSLFRMPVLTWMLLVTQFLLAFALPVITVALLLLLFDRQFDSQFFDPEAGADPLLWQHLFWIFGHPEVYIIILPSFGIISEVIPAFSRKPIFGYSFMVFSGIAIGFMGWGVWAHHMFVSGIGPISVFAFSMATMFIAVPTGVKILNWLATMWGGKLHFSTAMLFAVGTVTMFTIGGLSGVTHSLAPADTQQTDTYYIVAHFHYVIFGGGVLGLFAGVYFWWPKVFGHLLNERRGKIHFWTMLIGFNLTFGPMHVLGLQGMSRRINTYSSGFGFEFWNLVATIGSYILGASVLYFLWNVYKSKKEAPNLPAPGPDPWDARSLEWSIPSPTPEHNFDEIPVVESQDDWWFRKYNIEDDGSVVRISSAETRRRRATPSVCTSRRRRSGHSCWPSACRSSATASSSTCGSVWWAACSPAVPSTPGCWSRSMIRTPTATATTTTTTVTTPMANSPRSAPPATTRRERADGDRNGPATDTHHDAHDPHATNTGISNNKLAMWLFLSTECLLFGALISTYLIYKTRAMVRSCRPICSISRSRRSRRSCSS